MDVIQRDKKGRTPLALPCSVLWFPRLTLIRHEIQEDGSNCSIFSFDIPSNKHRLPLAKNALKKLRTMRHPGVIKVLDTVEVWRCYSAWH